MVGFAAAGPLLWHSPRGGRKIDADAACAAFHAEPGVDYPVAGVLVLDSVLGAILAVPMLAIVKIISDRLRPLKALGHFLEGE
jgi:hypothetical protein